jgi:predicted transcriptional regulator
MIIYDGYGNVEFYEPNKKGKIMIEKDYKSVKEVNDKIKKLEEEIENLKRNSIQVN